MPRANRYIVAGAAYHVTHRCHNRDHLLRFSRDRDAYRAMLRGQLAVRPDIRLLTYCITSNHVHLLLTSRGSDESISGLMQALEGEFAQAYNRRKNRSGAYWGDRFHATMIDSGEYLWRCMRYIDMNMVRAGVVRHPSEWPWAGYSEITGMRKRYRVISLEELIERAHQVSLNTLQTWYVDWIESSTTEEARKRDGKWTESIAVGGRSFVEALGGEVERRMSVEVLGDESGGWILKESKSSYSPFLGQENGCKAPKPVFLHT